MTTARPPRRILIACSLCALASLSCVDGLYPIANPNDPLMQIEMRLIASTDTIRAAGQRVVFQLVTTPVVTGYPIKWTTTHYVYLAPLGDGAFTNLVLPPQVPATVGVTAAYGRHEATAHVVVMPRQ